VPDSAKSVEEQKLLFHTSTGVPRKAVRVRSGSALVAAKFQVALKMNDL
jgi:hypothetical protein